MKKTKAKKSRATVPLRAHFQKIEYENHAAANTVQIFKSYSVKNIYYIFYKTVPLIEVAQDLLAIICTYIDF